MACATGSIRNSAASRRQLTGAEPMSSNIRVAKLSPHVGAEITRVDLTQQLDNSTLAAIREAFVGNGVVFFRDQSLDFEQHKAFAKLFGKLFVHPAGTPVPGHPELIPIKADENSTKVAGEE